MAFTFNGKAIRRLITHNGSFHSDDVFATALLLGINEAIGTFEGDAFSRVEDYMKYYYDGENGVGVTDDQVVLVGERNLSIERVSSEQAERILSDPNPDHHDFIMYDVGNTEFDHHKAPRELRPNKVPYSAFGKLWREFGPGVIKHLDVDETQMDEFDRDFVQPICLNDNQGVPNVLSLTIKFMNGADTFNDYEQFDSFVAAVDYAQATLSVWFSNMSRVSHEAHSTIIGKHSGVILDSTGKEFMYIYDHTVEPRIASKYLKNISAVIYPHSRGGWAIESLSDAVIGQSANNRWLAPETYWGRNDPSDPAMAAVGAKFCHATGFLMSFLEKEDAMEFGKACAGKYGAVKVTG